MTASIRIIIILAKVYNGLKALCENVLQKVRHYGKVVADAAGM